MRYSAAHCATRSAALAMGCAWADFALLGGLLRLELLLLELSDACALAGWLRLMPWET